MNNGFQRKRRKIFFQDPPKQSLDGAPGNGREEDRVSASRTRFAKNDDENPTAESEALFDSSGHSDTRVVGGQVMCFAKYPEAASTVVEFECACVGDSERICHATGDGDLFVMKSSSIAIDGFNAYAMGASRQY